MALVYKDRVKETTTTTGTGTLTLAGAASGYQAFSSVGDGNTCVYGLEASDGGWEVGIGTYTLSGTTLARTTILASSNSGSAITLPAGTHNVYVTAESSALRNGFLRNKAESPTTAGVTGEVGTMHVLDISGLTADRDFTLPATAAVGDRVGVMLSAGDDTYELLLKPDAADTINGGSAGAEWSRLFITGEVVIFRCVTANSAWMVEHDGRIPCKASVRNDGTTTQAFAAASYVKFQAAIDAVEQNIGDAWDNSTGTFTARRAGTFQCAANASWGNMADGKSFILIFYLNGVGFSHGARGYASASTAVLAMSGACTIPCNANDTIALYAYNADTASRDSYAGAARVGFSVNEVLP